MANSYYFYQGFYNYYTNAMWYAALGFITANEQWVTDLYNENGAYYAQRAINYVPSAYKIRYHAPTGTYIFPGTFVNFTSKDLVTWTPRASFMATDASGPVVIGTASGYNLPYTFNANNYVSGMYDVMTEFYVPRVFPYISNVSSVVQTSQVYGGGQTLYTQLNTQSEMQTTGVNVDLVWYVKAK
jgi:hypothetical protein